MLSRHSRLPPMQQPQQRVAMALAIFERPGISLSDEPMVRQIAQAQGFRPPAKRATSRPARLLNGIGAADAQASKTFLCGG
jgi:hypothetical protein